MNTASLRIVCVCLLILVAALYLYTDKQRTHYATQAKPAAKQILTEIADWQKPVLLQHLSPQARATLSDEQLDRLLDHYREFGPLQSIGELHFSRLVSIFSLLGDKRINYTGTAQFNTGAAQVNITLIESSAFEHTPVYKVYNLTIQR